VTGVRAVRMRLGLPDSSGRQSVEVVGGSHFTVEADLVIKALGFDAEPLPTLWSQDALEVTRWGTLKVNHRTFQTSLPGVFAAGDIVRGASLVVWATAAMRRRRYTPTWLLLHVRTLRWQRSRKERTSFLKKRSKKLLIVLAAVSPDRARPNS
jgi:NADPH-dependent glutamate synthase beta subunit-like oxidoreductase